MDHDVPGFAIDIDGNFFMRQFPKQAFVIPPFFRLIDTESEVIAAIRRQAFFALAGVVSFTLCFHPDFLLISK